MHVWNFSITQLVKPSLILLRLSTDFAIAGLWITSNGFNQKYQLHNAHVWINKSWDVHQVLNITSASLQKKTKKKTLMTLLSRNLFIQLRIFKLANVASVYGTKNMPEKKPADSCFRRLIIQSKYSRRFTPASAIARFKMQIFKSTPKSSVASNLKPWLHVIYILQTVLFAAKWPITFHSF